MSEKKVGCDNPDGTLTIHPERECCINCAPSARPLADPTETLALIAETARQEERAAVIAYLRAEGLESASGVYRFSQRHLNWRADMAAQIERGEHVSRIRGQQ